MSNDPFESPKALIQGTKEDLVDLQALVATYIQSANYLPFCEPDKKTGGNAVKVRVVEAPPARIRYLASNILNNLRHSLDQAANEAAVLLGKVKRDGYFPFAGNAEELKSILKRHCRGFDPELVGLLLEFRPYGGGDDFLYALSKVAGPNKHQVTINLECELTEYILQTFGGQVTGPAMLGLHGWDKKKREIHFATLFANGRYNLQIDPARRLPLTIELAGSQVFAGQEISTVLNSFIVKCESIVLSIEAGSGRILSGKSAI